MWKRSILSLPRLQLRFADGLNFANAERLTAIPKNIAV
jgi:hypothetical protein